MLIIILKNFLNPFFLINNVLFQKLIMYHFLEMNNVSFKRLIMYHFFLN